MSKTKVADISKDQMLADGWVESKDELERKMVPMEKSLPNRNPLNNSEDSNIKLILHGMYNVWTFAVLLPDGGMLNFVANSMKELKEFEKMINFYDPPF